MTAEERLRQYAARSDKNTVAVQPHVLAMLRHSGQAENQQQVRAVETSRKQESDKRREWYGSR